MIFAYFDGCDEARNEKGVGTYGFWIVRILVRDGRAVLAVLVESSGVVRTKGPSSHNVAEYAGLIAALEWLIKMGLNGQMIKVRGDSQLVINQMFRGWRIRKGMYVEKAMEVVALKMRFPNLTGEWIPREENSRADQLARVEWERSVRKQLTI